MRKTVALLVLVATLAAPSASWASSPLLAAPSPLTPNEGETVYVNPVSGITLTLSYDPTAGEAVNGYAEASLSPTTTTSSGTFADPLAFRSIALSTHEPTVDEVKILPSEFEAPAYGHLYNGQTSGTVYWRPYVEGLQYYRPNPELPYEALEHGRVSGATRPFIFTTVAPTATVATPAPMTTAPKTSTKGQCRVWLRKDQALIGSSEHAAHKFKTARTRGELNCWRTQARKYLRLLKEANRNIKLYC